MSLLTNIIETRIFTYLILLEFFDLFELSLLSFKT